MVWVLYALEKHIEYEVEVSALGLPINWTGVQAGALRSLDFRHIDIADGVDMHHWHRGKENLPPNKKKNRKSHTGNLIFFFFLQILKNDHYLTRPNWNNVISIQQRLDSSIQK